MSERAWEMLTAVASVVGIVSGLASAWRDFEDARQSRIKAQLDALDLRDRSKQPDPQETEPKWVEL